MEENTISRTTGKTTDALPVRWFAFKVFYNRVLEIDKELKRMNAETYFPVQKIEKKVNGVVKTTIKPAISSLIFVRCSEVAVVSYQQILSGRVMMYSHVTDGVRIPSPIDEEEMRMFMLVTSTGDERLQYLDVGSVNYKKGQKVRVIGGTYKGCVGYIKRVKGNRRLLVSVEGVALVATGYVPYEFLEKI